MKKIILLLISLLLVLSTITTATAQTTTTITLLNPPPGDVLELQVGETYTFIIEVNTDSPFAIALALPDQFFPGRGIFFNRGDRASNSTNALLELSVTGKEPTDSLPDGFAPAAIVVGVTFPGGARETARFDFNVIVTP